MSSSEPGEKGKGEGPRAIGATVPLDGQPWTPLAHGEAACPVFAPAKPAYMPSMAITWTLRLKRVFGINIETCWTCGGAVRIIACIRLQAGIVPDNSLHSRHPWRSEAKAETTQW